MRGQHHRAVITRMAAPHKRRSQIDMGERDQKSRSGRSSPSWVTVPAARSDRAVEAPADRPPAVELRHLAALEAIAQEGSFRGAADRLGYVQSAISHQLAALERIVGARLVERSRGNYPVSLTPAGELLLEHAREILEQFRSAQSKLAALAEGTAGTLRVGVFHSVAANVLPRVLPAFARACPEFRVQPTETETDTPLFSLLEQRELDLMFSELPGIAGPFEGVELMEDPFILLVPVQSPLAMQDGPRSLEDIRQLPLIGFSDSRAQTEMLHTLAAGGLDARFACRADTSPALQALVAAGLGVAIVPYLAIDSMYPGTTVVELEELPARRIWLLWHRDHAPSLAARTFTDIARAACPRFRGRSY
jgi:DNA-binding transcriptional LysR family regulator